MATYTLVFTQPASGQSSNLADFPDDQTVIADARGVLSDEVTSIAIGRGAPACEVEWLGVWDWNGGSPMWRAED
jgi:hypothetical protein